MAVRPLAPLLLEYAALDAHVLHGMYEYFKSHKKFNQKRMEMVMQESEARARLSEKPVFPSVEELKAVPARWESLPK